MGEPVIRLKYVSITIQKGPVANCLLPVKTLFELMNPLLYLSSFLEQCVIKLSTHVKPASARIHDTALSTSVITATC